MRALLDAQLSHQIAQLLKARGFDVDAQTTRADIPNDASDERIMEIAAAEARAVVTKNIKDFRPIAARLLQRGESHAGLILVPAGRPRTKAAVASLAEEIASIMRANPAGLAGSERWIG